MRPDALRAAIAEDRATGVCPIAVVATVGTTSTTSVDPVDAIADVCEAEGLWLHVDSAYAGVAAMLPEHAHILAGADRADSLVVNPHKWLFTPFDLSAFFCRRMDVVRQAFSLVPDYLKTPDAARNLMDTGIQLGRRFRSLKLWMILRYFGAEGVREQAALPHRSCAAVRRLGRRGPGLRAPRARALQRRLLPREACRAGVDRGRTGAAQRGHPQTGERLGRDLHLAHGLAGPLHPARRDRQPADDRPACAPRVGVGAGGARRQPGLTASTAPGGRPFRVAVATPGGRPCRASGRPTVVALLPS